MNNIVRFTSTKLEARNKKGIIKPDENGYYDIVVGGLNTFNSMGQYYTLEGAKELFETSSILMRRIAGGNLRGELDHPKRLPNQSMDDYMHRLLYIDRDNEVCHFSEVWLDHDYGKNHPELNNPALVAIMAKVRPTGPKGYMLEQGLNNAKENVCFSIRSFTKDFMHRGRVHRVLAEIVTWDLVNEPGISIANKYDSASLEGLDILVTESMLTENTLIPHTVGNEDTKVLLEEARKQFNSSKSRPKYHNW